MTLLCWALAGAFQVGDVRRDVRSGPLLGAAEGVGEGRAEFSVTCGCRDWPRCWLCDVER